LPALSKANANSKKYTESECTLFATLWRITAYKNPIGAVVKNKTKAMQKSNKLLNKGMRLVDIIKLFFRIFSLRKK
jgi:hypothetical protein